VYGVRKMMLITRPDYQGIIQPNDLSSFSPGVSALMVACVRGNTMAAKQLIRPKRNTTDGLGRYAICAKMGLVCHLYYYMNGLN